MRLRNYVFAMFACCLTVLAMGATASAAPPVVDAWSWIGEDANKLDLDGMSWESSGVGDYEQRDECDVDMYMSCDPFLGAAPLIRAGQSGSYAAGSSAGWTYTVPGGPDAYIKEASAIGVNVTGDSELTQEAGEPHAFLGLWDGSSWSALDTSDEGIDILTLDQEEGEEGVRQVKLGMEATTVPTMGQDHWAGLAQLGVILGDDVSPEFDYDTGAIPTGWVNEDPFTISAPSHDDGLGLAFVVALSTKRGVTPWVSGGSWGDGWNAECQGDTADPCPADTPNDFELEIRPAEIREGINTVSMAAVDAMYNQSNDGLATQFDLKVDTIKAKVDLSGTFMTAPGMVLDGPLYNLDSLATDGELYKENSGVVDLKVLIDDVVIDSDSQSCSTENCDLGLDTDIDPDNYSNGDHVLKVKATDAVGHVTTETVEFEVDR